MTQPIAYSVTTLFANDEADGVAGRSTARTAAIDVEFANISTSIAGIRNNLALIQRDDGQLLDHTVDTYHLTTAVLTLIGSAGFNVRGAWLTATAYAVRDMVTQGTGTYVCATANTSGTFATDLAAGKWVPIFDTSVYAASGVSVAPTGVITAINVQAALAQIAPTAAMLPVTQASTIAAARGLLGLGSADSPAFTGMTATTLTVSGEVDIGVARVLVDANHNFFAGETAGNITLTGTENTGIGYKALQALTGGVSPAGSFNTAVGSFSLFSLTTGNKNSGFGRASLDFTTTGYENTGIGYGSGHFNQTGYQNVGVGMEACHDGVSAHGNTGVGAYALRAATGSNNTGVGLQALFGNVAGTRNTGVGVNALYGNIAGNDNTAVGYQAGLTNTGSGNTFLGEGADATAGRANVIVIGVAITATADNTITIGNSASVTLTTDGDNICDIGTTAKRFKKGIFASTLHALNGVALTAGGATGLLMSSTTNFGIHPGSGVPTMSAGKGSLYLRSDGSSGTTRAYINTDGGTTWTAVNTVA